MRQEVIKIIYDYIDSNTIARLKMEASAHLVRMGDITLEHYKANYKELIKLIYDKGLFTFKQYNAAIKMVNELYLVEHKEEEL